MGKKMVMRLGLVVLLVGIMLTGYGGLCNKDTSSGSSGGGGGGGGGNGGGSSGDGVGENGNSLVWQITTIDYGKSTSSVAVDSNNHVHLAYFDSINGYLKYATNSSGNWTNSLIGDVVGEALSVAVGSNNKFHIIYWFGSNSDLKYTTNVSGDWVTSTIDDNTWCPDPSIALDSNNKVHVSYLNGPCLKYATNISGDWVVLILDPDSYNSSMTNDPIVIDSNNKVHIFYRSDNAIRGVGLTHITNASGKWIISMILDQIGNPLPFSPNSMAIDSNNKFHLVSTSAGSLYYLTNISGNWVSFRLLDGAGQPSIAIDRNNKVHICYGAEGSRVLKDVTNIFGNWQSYTIDTVENVLYLSPRSIAVDSNNKVHISYLDVWTKNLKYATTQ